MLRQVIAVVGIGVALTQGAPGRVAAQAPTGPAARAADPAGPPARDDAAVECLPAVVPAWDATSADGAGRVWADAELLLWWQRGASLPPLATTSPPGTPLDQAGVLGAPGTSVLFGGTRVNGDLRIGGRFA